MASPPVVRFLDFGQYKYELTKREKEAKRKQRSVTFKEVRLKPKIGQGDFDTKVRRAIEFLEEGDRIKVSVQFRGRELTHPEIGRNLLARFTDQIKDHGILERAPLLEGKAMHITVASVHKPRNQEGPATPGRTEGDAQAAPEASRPAPPAPAATSAPAPAGTSAPTAARPAVPAPAATSAPAPAGSAARSDAATTTAAPARSTSAATSAAATSAAATSGSTRSAPAAPRPSAPSAPRPAPVAPAGAAAPTAPAARAAARASTSRTTATGTRTAPAAPSGRTGEPA